MRSPRWDSNGIKKGSWSPEEDQMLIAYINRYGIWNWSLMPKYAGLSRNGKSCRLRWLNYLNPQKKRGNITKEEARIIVNWYAKLGKRWSEIATKLPGRTDNEIKNYWNTHFRKSLKEKAVPRILPEDERIDIRNCVEDEECINIESNEGSFSKHSAECSSSGSDSSIEVNGDSMSKINEDLRNFWTQPFSCENNEQDLHTRAWCHCHCQVLSSPYCFCNNEY